LCRLRASSQRSPSFYTQRRLIADTFQCLQEVRRTVWKGETWNASRPGADGRFENVLAVAGANLFELESIRSLPKLPDLSEDEMMTGNPLRLCDHEWTMTVRTKSSS
jgi:hypothetical protein